MFEPVSSRVNFPQLEEKILGWWQSKGIFQRSLEARQGGPRFVFYEGPPTANGSPGIHHVLARVFKDVIPRYKVMKGYYAPRIAGWDTHGLPVELEVEKQLGFTGKAQIEEYGIEKFNALCRESVFKYLKEWNELTERIGFWVDLEHPYITMDNNYVESVWWAIKKMWDKGLVYQGYRVTPHCPRCGTSLSSHEVALGYEDDVEDPSIYIKFRTWLSSGRNDELFNLALKKADSSGKKPAYFLAWTTTPWTLPGNTALAVNPEADYTIVEVGDEFLVLADALRERVGVGDKPVIMRAKGSELVKMEYEPLFNPHEFGVERLRFKMAFDQNTNTLYKGFEKQEPPKPSPLTGQGLSYKVIEGDFVSMEEGTGIVHIAPAYGEVDYQAGQDNDLDFVHTVDLQGKVIGSYPFAGKFVKDADKDILADLETRGLLYKSETIRHTYPFCWRCGTPLLYYAKQTWYIKTTAVKERLISGNEEINWYPEHIKYGRFGDWLQNNVDWAFSRERYWGTPLPVWRCQSCGYLDCIGGLEELKKKAGFSGLKEPVDLHRPFVDEVTFACPKCRGKMSRVPEVIDCWFDSGAMPFAQWHYPSEHQAEFKESFPSDFICEAVDQTRGWFYSLHAISTLLFERPCYRNVICLGHILDAEGEKMSKARGNVVQPFSVINKHGADALRWYLFTSSPPGNVRRFSEDMVAEVTRRFLSTLWNVYSFFVIYANIDKFVPTSEVAPPAVSELDRWIISELHQLIADVDTALDSYNPTEAGRKIEGFIDGLSNWYVRRSRRRFWKSENDTDKLSAYNTLYQCLVTLARLLAPFTPFVAEELYQNLVRSVFSEAPESVHLTDFPGADESQIDKRLMEDVQLAMKVCSLGRAARAKAGIKVRQPLDVGYVIKSAQMERALKNEAIRQSVLDELNIKEIKLAIKEEITAMATKPDYVVDDVSVASTAIYTKISPQLAAEGLAREIVHRVQTMRRSAGFEIADHIITYYQVDDDIRAVMASKDLAGYIQQETLSRQLIEGVPEEGVFKESYKLGGHTVLLGVKRAS